MGQMGHKDLVVALGPNNGNTMVVTVNNRAMEVLKNDCFAL